MEWKLVPVVQQNLHAVPAVKIVIPGETAIAGSNALRASKRQK